MPGKSALIAQGNLGKSTTEFVVRWQQLGGQFPVLLKIERL
jgi:hypothetical protein